MNKKLKKSLKKFDRSKEDRQILISGELGITLGGRKLVEVPNRKGFVYVRLKGNTSELIQAYNATVSPVYDMPVFVTRSVGIYKVVGRNLDRYPNQSGQAPFLPKHGAQHSFNHDIGAGGDVVWVYSQQFMPLLSYPSGTEGGMTLSVYPHFYEWNGQWKFAQTTGTPDYTPYIPTITGSARMVLSYIDPSDNSIQLVPGTPFDNSITGSAQLAQYIPDIPREIGIPLAAVRLTTGTTTIGWNAIYDLRDFYTVGKPSGSVGGAGGGGLGFVGQDEGAFLATGTVLNVTGAGATLSVSGTVFNLNVSGGGGGGLGVMAWDEGQPLGTGTVFNFVGTGVEATISGSVVRVSVSSGGGGGRTLVAEATPTGTVATFSSIPGTYKTLEIDYVVRSATVATSDTLLIELNSDTTVTNYRAIRMIAYGINSILSDGVDERYVANVAAANSPTNSAGSGRILIPFYAGTTFKKQMTCNWSARSDDSSNYEMTGQNGVEWENAAAITQIDLKLLSGANFAAGSTIRLYGID